MHVRVSISRINYVEIFLKKNCIEMCVLKCVATYTRGKKTIN